MKTKTSTAPATDAPIQFQLNIDFDCSHKDKHFSGATGQVLRILLCGGRYSVRDLVSLSFVADPRSHIRNLRKAGIQVSDEWVNTEFSRYKIYFMKL